MDENVQAKFEERLKELLAAAKKKKNVLEYQEINDFFQGMTLEEDQFDKILETLEQNNVDVLRISEDDDVDDEEIILSEEETRGGESASCCQHRKTVCGPRYAFSGFDSGR